MVPAAARSNRREVEDAVRPRGVGSDGAGHRLAGWRGPCRVWVAGQVESPDNLCPVKDGSGYGGSNPHKMRGRGADGAG